MNEPGKLEVSVQLRFGETFVTMPLWMAEQLYQGLFLAISKAHERLNELNK